MKLGIKSDKYRKTRGGYSRFLDIRCARCKAHVFYYQKDGPGPLKRLYLDRIAEKVATKHKIVCGNCGETLGIYYVYPKEKRPTFRLFEGAVTKRIVKLF